MLFRRLARSYWQFLSEEVGKAIIEVVGLVYGEIAANLVET